MWFKMISSYPATNCSSVNGVCSLKWEYGHKREIHGEKKEKKMAANKFTNSPNKNVKNKLVRSDLSLYRYIKMTLLILLKLLVSLCQSSYISNTSNI